MKYKEEYEVTEIHPKEQVELRKTVEQFDNSICTLENIIEWTLNMSKYPLDAETFERIELLKNTLQDTIRTIKFLNCDIKEFISVIECGVLFHIKHGKFETISVTPYIQKLEP